MELQEQVKRLQLELSSRPVTSEAAKGLADAKAGFEVPEGEEHLVHAYVTHKNSVALPNPVIEPFQPTAYAQLAKDPSFKAEVIHSPKNK